MYPKQTAALKTCTHTQTNDKPLLLRMLECCTKYMIVFYITKFLTYVAQSKKTNMYQSTVINYFLKVKVTKTHVKLHFTYFTS